VDGVFHFHPRNCSKSRQSLQEEGISGIPDDMAQAYLWKKTPLGRGSIRKDNARLAPAQVQVNSLSLPV
jgi:hypothetical protein